jgi:diguanylate cyclase (GGDEF)-like protein
MMTSLSRATRLSLSITWITGVILFFLNIRFLKFENNDGLLLIGLVLLASFSQIFKVDGTTNRSHYAVSFVFYAFTMMYLGMPATIVVIVIANLAEWMWHRPLWYISLFNTCCYMIAIQAANFVYWLVNPSGELRTLISVLAILAGMVVYTLINHVMVGIIIWLARGEDFIKSGIFDFMPLLVDLTMLVTGASLNYVWNYNPYAVLLFAIPLYLIYSTLRVPALQRKVEIDQKTGIYNHEYFMQQFHNELARANRYDRPLTVLMGDLDLLREINNTYGHLAGDEVIKTVARIIQKSVREYDIVARFGGEEYAVLMPETSLEIGYIRAEEIRAAVERAAFVIPTSEKPIKVTISLGVAGRENSQQSKEEVLHNADTAQYQSKAKGRNCTHAFREKNIFPVGHLDNRTASTPGMPTPGGGEQPGSDYKAAQTGRRWVNSADRNKNQE